MMFRMFIIMWRCRQIVKNNLKLRYFVDFAVLPKVQR